MNRVSHLMSQLKPNPTHSQQDIQYVLITGCSHGNGVELVERILQTTNYYVIATHRSPHEHHVLQTVFSKYPGRYLLIPMNLHNEQSTVQSIGRNFPIAKHIDMTQHNAMTTRPVFRPQQHVHKRPVYKHPYW